MQRRRHRGHSTAGGAGQGLEPGSPLATDSEDEELRWRPAPRDAASPHVVLESDLEEPDVCPDVRGPRKRRHTPAPGYHLETAAPHPDPDVRGPKKHRFTPQTPPDPDVGRQTALPDVQPPNRSLNPSKVADPDAKHLEGNNPTRDVASETDVRASSETALFHPNCRRVALEVSSHPDVEERGPNPDVGGAKNGCRMLVVDSDTDVEEAEVLPDAGCPKIRRTDPNVPNPPDVEMEPPNPDVGGPPNGCWPLADSDTDVEMENSKSDVEGHKNGHRGLLVDSDTDVEEDRARPDVECLQNHQTTQNVPNPPNIEVNAPETDVEGSRKGRQALLVDSDTDVEENTTDPDVANPRPPQPTRNVPDPQIIEMETQNAAVEGSQKGRRMPVGDSDTDVEEDTSNPDVGRPESHDNPPGDPDVNAEPANRGGEGQRPLLVESDTDVEEDTANPDVGPPKPHRATQNGPRNPHLEMKNPNPRAEGPRTEHWTLAADSDTDVEENEVNPTVGCPKIYRWIKKPCKDPDVEMKNASPDVEEPSTGRWNLEVDSDTDVEENDPSRRVFRRKNPKTPQNTWKDPTVVMETPNPDVGGLRRGSVASSGDSDTDVEDLNVLPNLGDPKPPGTTREVMDPVAKMAAAPDVDPQGRTQANAEPDVKASPSNPAVGASNAQPPGLKVDSDTDVEDNGVIPDVGPVPGCQGAPGDPDVAPPSPHPDVPSPPSPGDGSDTDMEEVAPTPDVRSRIQTRTRPHPDVGGHHTAVEETDPNHPISSPKRQRLSPKPPGDARGRPHLPQRPDSTPNPATATANPATATSNPAVETPRPDGKSPEKVADPAVRPDVPPPASLPRDPPSGVTGDAGISGGTVTESDAEEDPDLFLEPTQNFLSPVAEGATPDWDPEEPTQLFFLPKEEEEEEEEEETPSSKLLPDALNPPTEPVTVPPVREGPGTGAAGGGEVGEGPRRSQRLAKSRGGGARKGGVTAEGGVSKGRGGALPGSAPVRRSPRLQARPLPPERPTTKGQVEPRPPPKPRPHRAGPAPSKRQAQEEEEPPEVTQPQLRPRGGLSSTSPKVLFTGVVASPEMEVALKTLGGSMATSVFDCTHLVTDRVRRTVKFLCAVARGVPIVTPEWLHKSARGGRVLGPGPFLVRDTQQERHFGFSLAQALRRARRHPLLQGYEVHVTPNVRPEPEHMRDIVTCSGGTFLPTMPHTYGPRRLVITCEADAGCWAPALGARLPLTSAELLLTGLLRQRLQLQPFLFLAPPPTPPPHPNVGAGGATTPSPPIRIPPRGWGGVGTRSSSGTPPGPPQHPAAAGAPSPLPPPQIKGVFGQ